jgi:uncharacterized protein YbcI
VRSDLDNAIRPHLKALIEEILAVEVLDLLSDATLQTGRTGMIVVLENPPQMRASASSQKALKKNASKESRST